jgi:O-antigen/teichoic acid export membrane protein
MSNSAYWDAYKIVPVLLISYIVFSFQYYFNMGILITKKTKYLAYINMSNAVLNIILNFILISRHGIWGAAFATLICFIYKVIITYCISYKLYKISVEFGRILKLSAAAVALYFTCHFISINVVYLDMLLKFAIACLFPILLFLVNFYTADEKAIMKLFLKEPRSAISEILG